MARYPYLGTSQRLYTQYRDVTDGGWQPLTADPPGGTYDMTPGPGRPEDLPVPPGDGLWGPDAGGSQGVAVAVQPAAAKAAAKAVKGGDQ